MRVEEATKPVVNRPSHPPKTQAFLLWQNADEEPHMCKWDERCPEPTRSSSPTPFVAGALTAYFATSSVLASRFMQSTPSAPTTPSTFAPHPGTTSPAHALILKTMGPLTLLPVTHHA